MPSSEKAYTGSQVARGRLRYAANERRHCAGNTAFTSKSCQLAPTSCVGCFRALLVRVDQSAETRVVAQSAIQLWSDRSGPGALFVLEALAQSPFSGAASLDRTRNCCHHIRCRTFSSHSFYCRSKSGLAVV